MAGKRRSVPDEGPLSKRFNLLDFTDSLINDLNQLRSGKISIREAAVRAELARQVLRAVGLVVAAQKYIEGQAMILPPDRNSP
jgi:hypothetical protein